MQAVGVAPSGADDVQPSGQRTEPRRAAGVELGRGTSALAIEQGVEDTGRPPLGRRERCAIGKGACWTDRDLLGVELGEEPVLLEDFGRRPALRAIELRHYARAIGELDLVDPVLERVQRIAQRPDRDPRRLDRIEDTFRSEGQEEIGLVGGLGHPPILSGALRRRAEPGK